MHVHHHTSYTSCAITSVINLKAGAGLPLAAVTRGIDIVERQIHALKVRAVARLVDSKVALARSCSSPWHPSGLSAGGHDEPTAARKVW